ncbi:MAG: ubiquinone/menaquinone biosynthesis methyltransferase, partial [Verrucomicrobiota bacterium]
MGGESQDQNPAFVHRAFSSIAKRYVMTNHVLCLGIDLFWRRRVAKLVAAQQPEVVLDIATGSGDLAFAVQKGSPESLVMASDFCAPMLEEARKRGLQDLFVADGLALPLGDRSVDAITIGYGLRNMANWSKAIEEFSRVLKPGGLLVVLDFSLPTNVLIRWPYRFYLHRVLPIIAGWLTGNR